MNTNDIFSKKLTFLREKANLTKKELAEKLEISAASIGYYENGERLPDISVINKIALFFDVTCDELIRDVKPENVALKNEIGLDDKYIEILKQLTNESKSDKFIVNSLNNHTNIDAINAIFYGITQNPLILKIITEILNFDIDLSEMSEEKGNIEETEDLNKQYEGKGIFLRYSEWLDVLKVTAKDEFSKIVDDIIANYADYSDRKKILEGRKFNGEHNTEEE